MIRKREKMINPLWIFWLILLCVPMVLGTVMISNIYNLKIPLPQILLVIQMIFIINCFLEIKLTKNKEEGVKNE